MPAAPAVRYEAIARDPETGARLGRVHTPPGPFDTPAFMPVGTQGTIKGLLPDVVAATGAQCLLANTYHLMLRPGEAVVRDLGGRGRGKRCAHRSNSSMRASISARSSAMNFSNSGPVR